MAAMPRFTPTGKRADIAKIATPKQRRKTPGFPRFPDDPARTAHTASARSARLRMASQAKSAAAMKMVGKITSLTACQPK